LLIDFSIVPDKYDPAAIAIDADAGNRRPNRIPALPAIYMST